MNNYNLKVKIKNEYTQILSHKHESSNNKQYDIKMCFRDKSIIVYKVSTRAAANKVRNDIIDLMTSIIEEETK
jgi:hypothetical protein